MNNGSKHIYRAGIVSYMLLSFYLTSCPLVVEEPAPLEMSGTLSASSMPSSLTIKKVIAIDDTGRVVGEAVPQADKSWSMPAVSEENMRGVFWVEMTSRAGITYYNEGLDVMFVSDWYYTLNVGKTYIPVGSAGEFALIGKDDRHPLNENYVLIRNIRLGGAWTPLCKTSDKAFSGVFDGHNFTISGITLPDNGLYQSIGLFGYVRGGASGLAKIENLNLKVVNSVLTIPAINGQCTGMLAGFAENATFDKITVNGPSQGLTIKRNGGGDFYIGGIVGKITGANSAISRSATLFPIGVEADNGLGAGYIGGIAGYSERTNEFTKCYTTGLTAISNQQSGAYAGGITGYHAGAGSASITECYALGYVSAAGGGDGIAAAGGLVGGGDSNPGGPGLEIKRSLALMNSVSAEHTTAGSASAGGLSGYRLAGTNAAYQLEAMVIKPASAAGAVNGEDAPQPVTALWLGSPPLLWDFQNTWQWDAVKGVPKFLWQ
jgi:hypothetical protein